MFRAALSTKTLAIVFALFGLQFVCFCCGVPIRGYNMAEQAGAVDPRAIDSPLMRPPEERYTGITWSITCPPPGMEHRELVGYLVCPTPLTGLIGTGGQIGLLPMLLLGIAALVAGYFLLWRLPLLLLRLAFGGIGAAGRLGAGGLSGLGKRLGGFLHSLGRRIRLLRGRLAYMREVRSLADKAAKMRAEGLSSEAIARLLQAERRLLGVKYKDLTPADELLQIYHRNLTIYDDVLGPSVEWLRNVAGKSWEQIIESASRTGNWWKNLMR